MPTRPTLRQAATGPLSEGRGRRIVKIVGLQVALPLAILAIAFATAPARAKDDATAVSKQALEAKIKYCEVCHGQSGQGFQGYYPIPRLAVADFTIFYLGLQGLLRNGGRVVLRASRRRGESNGQDC